jgi:hypothetical protein
MSSTLYIGQNMQQLLNIDFLIKEDDNDWLIEKINGDIVNISFETLFNSENKRYMIVAEPGYGKTRLLKEIVLKSEEKKKETFFIDAKKIKSFSIEDSLKKCKYLSDMDISEEDLQKQTQFKTTENDFVNSIDTIVCIDALDEVSVSELYELLERIEEFIENNSDIKIFLSCRTHHLKKINFNFATLDFKFISLKPFGNVHIKQFLKSRLGKKIDLESMYQKSKMSNLIDFISIPRYLYYFSELLKDGSLNEVINMSRSSMFEHFIYRKLDKELQKNTPQSQIDLLKRVLEKLAFIMKIDGVSEITKDELMTVFEKMDSNFSQIGFRDDLISKLYDRSLLKDNVETIEFENQEFLDYLSAKKLARFEKVEQVLFDVAIEPHIKELYISWFYVLPFVFELKPSMIEIFLDFLDKHDKHVFSSEYFQALLNIEPEKISKELKSKIFDTVFDYYTNHTKWFDANSGSISRKLSRYYEDSKYSKILNSIDGRKNNGHSLTVLRTNAVRLISLIIGDKRLDENKIKFWQEKVSKWLKEDVTEYRYLHRNILEEFAGLSNGDFEWIKKHRFIFEKGIQVQAEYARACFKVAPNDTFSIDVYLDTHKYWYENKEDIDLSRSDEEYNYILRLSTPETMKYALKKIWESKEEYYPRFCENLDNGIFEDEKKNEFKDNLLNICNDELLEFLKECIIESMDDNSYHWQICNGLYTIFIEVIVEKDKEYIKKFVEILEFKYANEEWHFYHSFLDYVSIDFLSKHFDDFVGNINKIKDRKIQSNILEQIYYRLPNESCIREKITSIYPDLIKEQEVPNYEATRREKLCEKWKTKIEPEPNKFKTDLFQFFVNHKEKLVDCLDYEEKYKSTVEIAKEVLKNNNPLKRGKVEKKENGGATIWQVNYYESCIVFAHKENIDLDQETRDNVFRYLPFNINSDYETTLAVAKTPSSNAIADIVDVYAGKRDDDLGIYHVRQFTELYNSMKLKQFEPILLKILKDSAIEEYEKVYITQSLPSDILTAEIIKENKKELGEDSDLYQAYLSILMRKHLDKDAIVEAFEWTKRKAKNIKNNHRFYDPMSRTEYNISIGMAHSDYSIEKDKELLLLSSVLSGEGQDNSSTFLKKVVESHLKYLLEIKPNAHEIILDIEKFLDANKDKKDLHWFEYTLQDLKQVYLGKVKESNIVKAIKKYNQLENEDYLPVSSSFDLRELIKDVIEQDIRRWIEDEGAYKHIQELAKKEKNTNAEDFIQKSIKSQMELALVKRGFRDTDYNIIREEQLLDDKRLDFTVRYGLIGSVMVELKLGHNSEAKSKTKNGKNYIEKLKKYMAGSHSDYGLFVVFNVKDEKSNFEEQMIELNKLYEDVDKISVLGLNCV